MEKADVAEQFHFLCGRTDVRSEKGGERRFVKQAGTNRFAWMT
jgi:hypothetical protein